MLHKGCSFGKGVLHMSCAWVHVPVAWVIAAAGMRLLFVDSCTEMPGFPAGDWES